MINVENLFLIVVFYMQCACILKYDASLLYVLHIKWFSLLVLVALSDFSAGCHTDPNYSNYVAGTVFP